WCFFSRAAERWSRRSFPTRRSSDLGKLNKEAIAQVVNRANFDRVKGLFDDAVGKGATVAVGGTFEEEDLTVHPTMLTNVTPQMKDRKSTRLNSSHVKTSYAVFCLKK